MCFSLKPVIPSAIKFTVVVSILVVTIFFGVIRLCVPLLNDFLVVDKPLPHADALVVMAGEANIRLPVAAKLYMQGITEKILLTNDGIFSSWSEEKQRNLYEVEWAEDKLLKMLVPKSAIVKLTFSSSGSIYDAINTRIYVLDKGIKSIIIVTSDYHTKRSLWTFEKIFRNQPVAIGVYPAKSKLAELSDFRKMAVLSCEMVKYIYYNLKYINI